MSHHVETWVESVVIKLPITPKKIWCQPCVFSHQWQLGDQIFPAQAWNAWNVYAFGEKLSWFSLVYHRIIWCEICVGLGVFSKSHSDGCYGLPMIFVQ